MKLKAEHFQVYDLVTVCFDYASEILRTIYRKPVQYIGLLDLLKVACTGLQQNFRKTKKEIVVFGINFILKMFIEINLI
jgi:hypothetical protein